MNFNVISIHIRKEIPDLGENYNSPMKVRFLMMIRFHQHGPWPKIIVVGENYNPPMKVKLFIMVRFH